MTADIVRLFIGLELSDQARAALHDVRGQLQNAGGVAGKFYDASLYHLTLCFLGNLPAADIPQLERIMDSVPAAPFSLTLSSLGTFRGGSILWAGVQPCPPLMAYQASLAAALSEAGYALDPGEYTPHITLARQVKSSVPPLEVPAESFPVLHAILFHSTRMEDKLTYLPIFRSVFR